MCMEKYSVRREKDDPLTRYCINVYVSIGKSKEFIGCWYEGIE